MLLSTVVTGSGTDEEIVRKIQYDRAGEMTRYVDGREFGTDIERDNFGRPRIIRDPDNRELLIEYDAGGRALLQRCCSIDPHKGQKVRWSEVEFRYDELGRLYQNRSSF